MNDLPLGAHQLAVVQRQLPEYYLRIAEINMHEEARLDAQRTQPDKGNICLLDRSLEGDNIIPGLLAKYRGRPTVVYATDYPMMNDRSIYSALYSELSDRANFVFITGGGRYGEEERFRRHAHDVGGDHYLLMAYQFDYLCRQYTTETDDGEFVLLFDAEGRLAYQHKTGDSLFEEAAKIVNGER